MRLNDVQVTTLKQLFKDELGLELSDVEVQQAGTAILRMVIAKGIRDEHGDGDETTGTTENIRN